MALQAGENGAAGGTVVVAESQTSGRGRLNRSWLSLPGMGLYFSLLLRPNLTAGDLPKITLAAGLAVCTVIEDEYNLAPQIKWPNDLLLSGRKFAGILAESGQVQAATTGQKPYVVVGAGVNIYPPAGGFSGELEHRATSLSQHTENEIIADRLLEVCVGAIEKVVLELERDKFALILEQWKLRDTTLGRDLAWLTPQGTVVTGVSLGPDPDGMLRIMDHAGKVHQVISGDINLINKTRGKD